MFFYSLGRLLRHIRRRKQLGIALLMSIMFISILGNSAIFYTFEQDTWADLSIWDSFWYSLISITTIGYGDFYPESPVGRISATFFILVIGLGTFTTTLGMIIDWIADFRNKERKGMGKLDSGTIL